MFRDKSKGGSIAALAFALAALSAAPAPSTAAEAPQGVALPPPPANCRLSALATLRVDPHSYIPLIGGEINGHKVQLIAAISSANTLFRSATKAVGVEELHRAGGIYRPGGVTEIGQGWIQDLELDDMPRKVLSSYDVHEGFPISVTDGGEAWAANPTAMLGWQFWSLADNDFDLAAGSISLVRPAGCARTDTLPFNGGAYSQTPLLSGATTRVERRVTVVVDGVPLEAVLDTGTATSIMTRQGAFKLSHDWPLPNAQPQGQLATGGRGEISWAKARFKTFSIGEETIQNPTIAVADIFDLDQQTKARWKYSGATHPNDVVLPNRTIPDMILGADFFHAHHLLISNSRQMVYFVYNGAPIFR